MPVMDEGARIEVTFKPGGGFNKQGCLIESGNSDEYEKQGFITLELKLTGLTYRRSWGLEERFDDKDERKLQDVSHEMFTGTGHIKKSQWGRYALSIFGSDHLFTSMDVVIRNSTEKHFFIIPFKEANDLDLQWDEHFATEIRMDSDAFSELRDTQMTYKDCRVSVALKLDGMKGIYTTWSPSISEGRLLKFLDRKTDVTNHEEMPEHFDSVGAPDQNEFAISISIGGEPLQLGDDEDSVE